MTEVTCEYLLSPTPWYSNIVLSSFKSSGTDKAQNYLRITINFPEIRLDKLGNMTPLFTQWIDTYYELGITKLSGGRCIIEIKLYSKDPAIKLQVSNIQTISIGIDTIDTSGMPEEDYIKFLNCGLDDSISLNGTITVTCAACPAPELANVTPNLILNGISYPVKYGSTSTIDVVSDDYKVLIGSLSDEYGLASVQPIPSTESVSVGLGENAKLGITFGAVEKHSVLAIKTSGLAELMTEKLHVSVYVSGKLFDDIYIPAVTDKTYYIKNLPASGSVNVTVDDMTLNNKIYNFKDQPITLNNKVIDVTIDSKALSMETPPAATQYKLTVNTSSAVKVQNASSVLRLFNDKMNYACLVTSSQSSASISVNAGTYNVKTENFIVGTVLYKVSGPKTLDVKSDSTIQLNVDKLCDLKVKGFPNYLAMGGCANMADSNIQDFLDARTDVMFKYAGNNGSGDEESFLTASEEATIKVITNAAEIIKKSGGKVTPLTTMVSYTCNLSGGSEVEITDPIHHTHRTANYILALTSALKTAEEQNTITPEMPIAACFVLNPDFLGDIQQNRGADPDFTVPFRKPMQDGIDYYVKKGVISQITIPSELPETVRGYIQAVNWLTRTIGGDKIVFGWQSNVWATGVSEWVYDETKDPFEVGRQTAQFAKDCGITLEGPYGVHFHAVDRYERDDLSNDALVTKYCYGPQEWDRYFRYCEAFPDVLKMPLMVWQLPGSHIGTVNDDVLDDFPNKQFFGTCGSYLFGDEDIKKDITKIHPKFLDYKFTINFAPRYQYFRDLFAKPFDISQPRYFDFPKRGIFSILLGGGKTVGLVSPTQDNEDRASWTRKKTAAYADNRVYFDPTMSSSKKTK